jgi:hypothetical protein
MGLPQQWFIIFSWLTATPPTTPLPPLQRPTPLVLKHPTIPLLPRYDISPPFRFWFHFPSNPLPTSPVSPINISAFRRLITAANPFWPPKNRRIAHQALHDLLHGANPLWSTPLPAISVPNSHTAFQHGPFVTDTIASWLEEKFVSGPFPFPPFPNFRQNAIIAVEQTDKIRPVLDLSAPHGFSYNDALNKTALPKAVMSSAKHFSHALWIAGRHALFSKFDMHAAYKNIPQHPSVWPVNFCSF